MINAPFIRRLEEEGGRAAGLEFRTRAACRLVITCSGAPALPFHVKQRVAWHVTDQDLVLELLRVGAGVATVSCVLADTFLLCSTLFRPHALRHNRLRQPLLVRQPAKPLAAVGRAGAALLAARRFVTRADLRLVRIS